MTAPAASLRDRIATALSTAGAFCGNCGFEPGDRGKCEDCERCWSSYADAVLPLVAEARAAGRRDGLREAADWLTAEYTGPGMDVPIRRAAARLRARADAEDGAR